MIIPIGAMYQTVFNSKQTEEVDSSLTEDYKQYSISTTTKSTWWDRFIGNTNPYNKSIKGKKITYKNEG
jgi:hypothetical protein